MPTSEKVSMIVNLSCNSLIELKHFKLYGVEILGKEVVSGNTNNVGSSTLRIADPSVKSSKATDVDHHLQIELHHTDLRIQYNKVHHHWQNTFVMNRTLRMVILNCWRRCYGNDPLLTDTGWLFLVEHFRRRFIPTWII